MPRPEGVPLYVCADNELVCSAVGMVSTGAVAATCYVVCKPMMAIPPLGVAYAAVCAYKGIEAVDDLLTGLGCDE